MGKRQGMSDVGGPCTQLSPSICLLLFGLGHSAITTTMRYMQIRPSALEDVLHVLESGRG